MWYFLSQCLCNLKLHRTLLERITKTWISQERAFSIKQKSFFRTFEMLSFGKIQKIEETSFKIKRIQGGLGADVYISDITKADLKCLLGMWQYSNFSQPGPHKQGLIMNIIVQCSHMFLTRTSSCQICAKPNILVIRLLSVYT